MTQLIAATIFTVLMGYLFHHLALGLKRPYDNCDFGLMGTVLFFGLIGLGRILWLAFN